MLQAMGYSTDQSTTIIGGRTVLWVPACVRDPVDWDLLVCHGVFLARQLRDGEESVHID
jgi:hypothetical protein